jgi:hypothetical protein
MQQGIKKISLVLNINDPEQRELYRFVNNLPNGQKRNSSAFLRTLLDRAYQAHKNKIREERIVIRSEDGVIKHRL